MTSGGDVWHVKGDVQANDLSSVNCALWCLRTQLYVAGEISRLYVYYWDAVGHFQFTVEYLEHSFEQ